MTRPPPRARTLLGALASTAAALALTTSVAPAVQAQPAQAVPTQAPVAEPTPAAVTPTVQSVSLSGVVTDTSQGSAPAAAAAGDAPVAVPGQASSEVTVQPFRMVAVSWLPDPAVTGVTVEVRTRTAGSWSGWSALEPDDAADGAGTRTGSDPLWVGAGADGVQARLAGSTGAAPRDLRIELVEPGTSPADSRPVPAAPAPAGTTAASTAAATTVAAGPGPGGIISRAGWGADERIRTSCAPGGPSYTGTPKAAVIHHTAGTNAYTAAESAAIVRGTYAYHGRTLGWCDVGYNFMVDKYGQIFEGRAGGADRAVQGAHAGGFNRDTFGVSVIGDYTRAAPTAASIEAVSRMIAYKFGLHGTNPRGTATLTSEGGGTAKFARGTTVTKPAIMGHTELGFTACPGAFTTKLTQIRDRVAQLMAPPPAPPKPAAPTPAPQQPNALLWQARDTASPGAPNRRTYYGNASSTALSCDFDGDGRDDIATYDRGRWIVRHDFAGGPGNLSFDYGWPTGTPVCGDWDGVGGDGIGVMENGNWYLRNTATPGPASVISFGYPGARPVVGDWDNNGTDTLGVVNPNAFWQLRNSNSSGPADAGSFSYGWRGAIPVAGDWDGNGRTDLGVYDSGTGTWLLRNSPTPGGAERVFQYGGPNSAPVTGNLDGPRGDGIAVVNKAFY